MVVLSLLGFYNYYSLADPAVDTFYFIASGATFFTAAQTVTAVVSQGTV